MMIADLAISPLAIADISVDGVLAEIARARLQDYANKPLETAITNQQNRPDFTATLAQKGLSLIAEIKRASPSQGLIAAIDPLTTAKIYKQAGVKAISILTEERYFQGNLNHLITVANEIELPLLRKDFTVHPYQLFEAKNAGASAVLLIVALLKEHTKAYLELAKQLSLTALVEVHNKEELDIALAAGANVIGVNNRDLKTLTINLNNAPELMNYAKDKGFKGLLIAESGYSKAEELYPLTDLADAVLIGTSIAGSKDLAKTIKNLTVAVN